MHEPAVVVATKRQLNDLVRFCTPSSNFSIMTVDPTFLLGDFDDNLSSQVAILSNELPSHSNGSTANPLQEKLCYIQCFCIVLDKPKAGVVMLCY